MLENSYFSRFFVLVFHILRKVFLNRFTPLFWAERNCSDLCCGCHHSNMDTKRIHNKTVSERHVSAKCEHGLRGFTKNSDDPWRMWESKESSLEKLTKRRSQEFDKLTDVHSVTNFIGDRISSISMWNIVNIVIILWNIVR